MTWEDFMDSKQTLETSISDSKIVSFVFSVSYKSGEGTVFADFECKGPEIDSKAISAMKNSRASGKFGNEVMISNVLVSISNKVIKAEDMVIQIN